MNTNKFINTCMTASLLGLTFSTQAMALTNGSFTGNSLTGWSVLGDVTTQSGGAFLTTASLDVDDFPEAAATFNASGTSAYDISLGGFEAFAGLNAGDLDTQADFVYEGSILKQVISVNAGDTLSFNWNMFSNEGGEAMPKPDYAFVAINGAHTVLAPATSATIASVPYDFATGASFYSQTFANAATFTLAFGVVDVNDYSVTSALWFDNVKVTPVPEPETYAMLLAGLGLMGMVSRRRKM